MSREQETGQIQAIPCAHSFHYLIPRHPPMRYGVLVLPLARRQSRDPTVEALAIAARIEPDADLREAWFHDDPIRELSDVTAAQAIAMGWTGQLLALLRSIESGARGR